MIISEKEYARIIAKNLKRIMFEHDKTQADISHDLGISKSTVSSWMNARRTPRMEKIDLLCDYFGCSRFDIMEPEGSNRQTVRVSDDQAELIQLTMRAAPDNVALALALLRKLEGVS